VKLAIVVPLWNQWECTQMFLESFEACVAPGSADLILVDNGSTDFTARGLRSWSKRIAFTVIRNKKNLGCAPAWNQGARLGSKRGAAWIGVLNNDLVLTPGVFERCLARAESRGWDLVSPATREGALDYALEPYAAAYTRRCWNHDAPGGWFGWCFFVRSAVFRKIGFFDEGFQIAGCEDEDFARRMAASGQRLGVTGSGFVHHFGSRSLLQLKKQGGDRGEHNYQRLHLRWGQPRLPGPYQKTFNFFSRLIQRLRWGHLLKE
jgi:GT2 family glycosyltransferase